MKLLHVKKVIVADKVRLAGTVKLESSEQEIELYFEYPERFANFVNESADAFVPALLLPAMSKGENLEIAGSISEKLFRNLEIIQNIFHQWYPSHLKKVLVHAESLTKLEKNSSQKVGSFFSLGVDSFYTLLKHVNAKNNSGPALSHLIYMKGLERPLHVYKHGQEQEVISRVTDVANQTGTDCIVGETNIRDHFRLSWGPHYHGAGLASVALSLSAGLESVLIPSTDFYKNIFPWGTSPLLDHLWSTEKTNVVHDGSEAQRSEKIIYSLAKAPLAMKHLRVCTNNAGGMNNCGTCPKCVRTMLPLVISGDLDKATTFPDRLPSNWTRIVQINEAHDLPHAEVFLQLAKDFNADKKLIKALEDKIENGRAALFCKGRNFAAIQASVFHFYLIKQTIDLIKHPLKNTLKRMSVLEAGQRSRLRQSLRAMLSLGKRGPSRQLEEPAMPSEPTTREA
ncbi:hypothetical protein [Leptolyngbya sp. FACHB-261]|uniref:hypothetical protein n=1 Tax=Leptolyngbya sp. FACHB-261 TaxID=2692806 RepID=UPI001688F818|nr:hypothetical protein [Leptolyngbya sp. FACHB-261]MBD2100208.1 hypothetical protein [Leptolyngbya sp. FACHB-261]